MGVVWGRHVEIEWALHGIGVWCLFDIDAGLASTMVSKGWLLTDDRESTTYTHNKTTSDATVGGSPNLTLLGREIDTL